MRGQWLTTDSMPGLQESANALHVLVAGAISSDSGNLSSGHLSSGPSGLSDAPPSSDVLPHIVLTDEFEDLFNEVRCAALRCIALYATFWSYFPDRRNVAMAPASTLS
jgi:hypothetical protein